MEDYFSLLGIPKVFDFEKDLLLNKYFELQAIYQADKDDVSLASINNAYKVLDDIVSRAEYLLTLKGYSIPEVPSLDVSEFFELQDKLSKDDNAESIKLKLIFLNQIRDKYIVDIRILFNKPITDDVAKSIYILLDKLKFIDGIRRRLGE